jgi:hypothetical protein
MSSRPGEHQDEHVETVRLYALQALPGSEVPLVEAQIAACAECRQELEALRPVLEALASWPTDVLRPSTSLWDRLERRITAETGRKAVPPSPRAEPEWEDVAPGISCKVLATDEASGRVSMVLRMAPGAEYPRHTHAGLEELHMLDGELLVNETTLVAGDYHRSEPGSSDHRVWSKTGCTGILITSTRDVLR